MGDGDGVGRRSEWLAAGFDSVLARRKAFVPEGVPRLWRTGRIVEVLGRNRSDVELARDVYAFGRDFGYVVAREKSGVGFEQLAVDWR